MNIDLRQSKRYNEFIAVIVTALKSQGGSRTAGPYAGRIINISQHGACLLIPLGIPGAYDLYRSTRNADSCHLQIQGQVPSVTKDPFTLSAKPVWMEPYALDTIRAFKMGIEFVTITRPDQVDNIIENVSNESKEHLFEEMIEYEC